MALPHNLNININETKAVLDVTAEKEASMLIIIDQFERLMGGIEQTGVKLQIKYQSCTYSIASFKKWWEETHQTVEQRDIRSLKNSIDTLNRAIKWLDERIAKIEQPTSKPIKATLPRSSRKKIEPIFKWYARLSSGEEKIVKINAMLELVGIKVAGLTKKGNVQFALSHPTDLRCISLIENIYDKYGEDALRMLISIMGKIKGVQQRQEYWEALRYALLEVKVGPRLSAEQAYVIADKLFKMYWPTLQKSLEKHDGTSMGRALGKVFTKELMIELQQS